MNCMIHIKTSEAKAEWINKIIDVEFRLSELISVTTNSNSKHDIEVNDRIHILPDWEGDQPPYLFPSSHSQDNILLGVIFSKLGNYEKALYYFQNDEQYSAVAQLMLSTLTGTIIANESQDFSDYFTTHNKAIYLHYALPNADLSEVKYFYLNAIQIAPSNLVKAFTIKHFATFLLDKGNVEEAELMLNDILTTELPNDAKFELQSLLCSAWIKQINESGHKNEKRDLLKIKLWECLTYFENGNNKARTALLFCDATQVAAFEKSYSEALGYIQKAIVLFEEESLTEMVAQAQMQKGSLLKKWANDNQPQFFRPAIQAYQESLKVFTRNSAPDLFAEIHHQLGILYTEVPDEQKKKGVWASVAVSSYNEALNFYNKVDFPYQFAIICNNLGSSYTKFPVGIHSDNFEKALDWFREALDIFNANDFPHERSATLLNYLDASWFAGNKSEFNEFRFEEMLQKANEILTINTDTQSVEAAKTHIEKLNEIKITI